MNNGTLVADVEFPAGRAGVTVSVEAWMGDFVSLRDSGVFFDSADGWGFARSTDIRSRNGELSLPLGLSYIARPPVVAYLTVGETGDSGTAPVLVAPGTLERHRVVANGKSEGGTVPRTVTAYSWNMSDAWSAAVRANERVSEPAHFSREAAVTLPLPEYANIEGTYSVTTYPGVVHIVYVPTATYTAFQPQAAEGYPRFKESYSRLQKFGISSPDFNDPGHFRNLYLEPDTAYTIELWSAPAHYAGTPTAVATVTTGAPGSTTTLAVP
ncbi:MAG: hypothetical protein R3F34_09540 [Planctomycetota bacterium]